MTRSAAAICLLWSLAGGPIATTAQEETASPASGARENVTAELLEGRLKEIEGNPDIEDAIRKGLVDRYQEALDSLKQADDYRAREQEYRQSLQEGPNETLRLRNEIKTLQESDPARDLPKGLNENSTNTDLVNAVTRERTALVALESEFKNLEDQLSTLRTRPTQIPERLIAAQSELTRALSDLGSAEAAETADESSLAKQAELDRLRSLREKLTAELAMLEQEDLSDEIRMATTEAARDLAEVKIDAAESRIAAIQKYGTTVLNERVRKAETVVANIRREWPEAPKELDALVEELKSLIEETRKVSAATASVEKRLQDREAERKRIEELFNSAKRQFELGALEGALAQILLEQMRSLPSHRSGRLRLNEIKTEISEARRGLFQLDQAIRSDANASKAGSSGKNQENSAELERFADEIASLRETQDSLRTDLGASYRRWIRGLGSLDLADRQIIAVSQTYRDYSAEKLFFVRSSLPFSLQTLKAIPEGFVYCFGLNRIGELIGRLAAIPLSVYLLIAGVLAALIVPRRRFRRWLRESGQKTKRISSDHYSHTVTALIATILLAAPAAVALALLGWALMRQPDGSDWSFGLGLALLPAAWMVFKVSFVTVFCRKDGLGEVHFQWDAGMLGRIRRLAIWLVPVYLPVVIAVVLIMSEPGITHLGGFGRIAGIVGVLGIGYVGVLMMHPEKGIAASVHETMPRSLFGRLRHFWFVLTVAIGALLIVLFLAGYVFTGMLLIEQIEMSLTAVLAAFVVYGMVLRWFAIKERQFALQEALEEREARREAARKEQEGDEDESAGEDVLIPEIQEEEVMDLTEVGEQTRNLLGFLVGVGLLTGLWYAWTKFAPIFSVLDQFKAFGGFSLADIFVTVLIIAVTISTVRNLPGLLEMLILRRLDIDSGSRNSITTLAKYAVIAVGAAILFRTLGVDWSKLGWIAAALSVGIGFGLQEVVANFISGIILLFERPVRVGDVVTVDGVDGVVSRIQIRATTITNWDRKELIIPNKNFVTGTVLNWTLSNSVNRIVIIVGVAYGSDTERARQILVDVANDHPRIIDDPAPLATFEEFSADSLKLLLRCYVPDMDNRVVTITELHTEIDKRLKEAGIEIAFPQRDIHLRSVDPGVGFGGASGNSPDQAGRK